MPLKGLRLHALEGVSGPIGVALSGGGDSVALLHLLRARGFVVEAATVDHALRAESAAEAAQVARACAALGVPHEILLWDHQDLRGNLMAEARDARERLLGDWARRRGISVVALGHTADDQAEALLIGLTRAAGLDGLCGMRPVWQAEGLRWCRPMLDLTRADLRDYLRAEGISWIDDPSNENDRFLRVRMRKALAELAPLGLTAARLAESVSHLAQARGALESLTFEAAAKVCREAAGAVFFDHAAFAQLPEEIARRLLRAAVLWVSGAEHAPRGDALARLGAAIAGGEAATLWGCRLKGGWLCAEDRSLLSPLWDLPEEGGGALWKPLGARGLGLIADWRAAGLPRHVQEVAPALWQGDALIAAPFAAFGEKMPPKPWRSFNAFLLSH